MTNIEVEFTKQADEFLDLARSELNIGPGEDVRPLTQSIPRPLPGVMIRDFRQLSREERDAIRDAYFGHDGVAYFIVLNADEKPSLSHPLFHLAEQMKAELHLEHPLTHPLENHPNIVAKFGSDDTVKVFDF